MKILLLNQAFYPDVVSTAQHATDLAVRLVECGHEVTVLASNRAYDNPRQGLLPREVWHGIQIRRLFVTAFGKSSRWRRIADSASFLFGCLCHLLVAPRFDVVVALTTPPLIAFLAALFTRIKGGRLVYWVMDLNPDQAIAAGWLRKESITARWLNFMLRYTFRQSDKIIALDRFMQQRITNHGIAGQKVVITPPWSHDHSVHYDPVGRDAFRSAHGLAAKFVVMYSGNHSPCHPLDTVLEAAVRLADRHDIAFCFVGGGSEHAKVRQFAAAHRLPNVLCLPYQPLRELSASLSAADLHVVVIGTPFVGIVHPCKIYNICALGIPVLYVGPDESHITDLAAPRFASQWLHVARHGDVDGVVQHIRKACQAETRDSIEQRRIAAAFSQDHLLNQMVCWIENTSTVVPAPAVAAAS